MNKRDATRPVDAPDRQTLRTTLRPADDAQTAALRARVLAQWQLRQAAQGAALVTPGGAILAHSARLRWVGLGLALTLLVAGTLAWRTGVLTDPTLDELSQPDVLSVLSLDVL